MLEGRGFRDRAPEFAELNCEIVGASFDTVEENLAFAEAEEFPYRLLSDTEKVAGAAYETVRKEGEKYAEFGVPHRYSYLIDPDRVVRRAYEVEDVNAHPEEVIADLRRLQGG